MLSASEKVLKLRISVKRRKQTCCLRLHAGHNWCLLDFRKADRYVVIISTVKGTDLFEPIFWCRWIGWLAVWPWDCSRLRKRRLSPKRNCSGKYRPGYSSCWQGVWRGPVCRSANIARDYRGHPIKTQQNDTKKNRFFSLLRTEPCWEIIQQNQEVWRYRNPLRWTEVHLPHSRGTCLNHHPA